MRDARVMALAAVTLAAAWIADRLLWDAFTNAGTYAGGNWSNELLLAADRIPKLVVLVLLGWIAFGVFRRRIAWPVAVLFVVVGLALAVVPTVVLAARFEPLMRIVSQELFWPRQFVMWTATGMLLVGLVALTGAPRRLMAGPWARVAVALAAMALTWPADALLSELFIGAAEGRTVEAMLIAELAGRAAVMAVLLALCVMTIEAVRHAAAGGAMIVVGGVVFVGFALVALLGRTTVGVEPGTDSTVVTGYLGRWASGGVLLLGAWEVARVRTGETGRMAPSTEAPAATVPDRA